MGAVLEGLVELVNRNEALVRRGRYLSTTFLVETGETAWLVTVIEGRIARLERGPFLMRQWRFAAAPASSRAICRFRRYILPVLDEIRALK